MVPNLKNDSVGPELIQVFRDRDFDGQWMWMEAGSRHLIVV